MKSKEEFEKSVFAKRDALLKKRKNTIVTAVSLACTALCVSLAVYAIKPMKAAYSGTTSDSTASTSSDIELLTFENAYPMTEIYREEAENASDSAVKIEKEEKDESSYASAEGIPPTAYADATAPENETNVGSALEDLPVTEPAIVSNPAIGSSGNFGYTPSESFDPNTLTGNIPATSQKHETTAKKYPTNEEVASAAISYLTDSEKTSLTGEAPMITITHHTDPEKADEFQVYFKLSNGKIKLILNAYTLELIEKK